MQIHIYVCVYIYVYIHGYICMCIFKDIAIISLSFIELVFQLRRLRILITNFNVCWGECRASPQYKQFLDTSWMSCHSTQF